MKTNFIFYITLIIFAQNINTKFQSKESSLDFIVNELVELNMDAGTPQEKILSLLGNILKSTDTGEHIAKKVFTGIQDRCTRGQDKLTSFAKKIKADILRDQSKMSDSDDKIKKIRKTYDKLKKQIKEAGESVGKLIKRFKKEVSEFKSYQIEASEKLDVIKRLKDIILDELVNGSKPGAFIQVDKFQSTVNELQTKMKNMDSQGLFTPLLSTLVTLASEGNFTNQKILRKILGLLNKIKNNLESFSKKHEKDFTKILALIKKQRNLKISEYHDLRKMQAEAASNIKFHAEVKAHANSSLGLLKSQKLKKDKELSQWKNICVKEKSLGNGFMANCKNFVKAIKSLRDKIVNK